MVGLITLRSYWIPTGESRCDRAWDGLIDGTVCRYWVEIVPSAHRD